MNTNPMAPQEKGETTREWYIRTGMITKPAPKRNYPPKTNSR